MAWGVRVRVCVWVGTETSGDAGVRVGGGSGGGVGGGEHGGDAALTRGVRVICVLPTISDTTGLMIRATPWT